MLLDRCGSQLLALARGDAQASWSANPAGFGVAALLAGRKPTQCGNCAIVWQA